jgi:hypothetical protein
MPRFPRPRVGGVVRTPSVVAIQLDLPKLFTLALVASVVFQLSLLTTTILFMAIVTTHAIKLKRFNISAVFS